MWLLLLSACGGPATECPDDTGTPPTSEGPVDPLDALEDCTPLDAGDRLDLAGACLDGVCLGQSKEEADEAFGTPGDCLAFGDYLLCFWGDGVLGNLNDADADGQPDEGARLWQVQALDPWDGASAEGLGLGIGLGCFTAALGTPDTLAFTAVEGELVASAATWNAHYFQATDVQDAELALIPDGRVEAVAFQNLLYQ